MTQTTIQNKTETKENKDMTPKINPKESLKFFAGSSHPELAKEISEYLDVPLGKIQLSKFSCGENYARIEENVRGSNVFVLQTTTQNVNEDIMELLLIIDSLKRASCQTVNVVLPHYPYSRQDKKSAPREPISAKLVATLIEAAGADRVITMDLHADQIQAYYDVPLDHLFALPLFAKYFQNLNIPKEDLVVVAPDTGRAKTAKRLADRLGATLAIIHKNRPNHNSSEVLHVVGEVENKICIIFDDMVDTAGTVCNGAEALKKHGAKEFYLAATHAVFSGPAIERLKKADFKQIVVTNTIPLGDKKFDKIKVISTAPLFAEAILRNNSHESVSELFK